jgi:REP element-mobilizing transposase RayT
VSGFKSVVTKRINILRGTPKKPIWQRSFHDHIIRNDKSLNNIREYIINNPKTWNTDENNIINYSIKDKACLVPTGHV